MNITGISKEIYIFKVHEYTVSLSLSLSLSLKILFYFNVGYGGGRILSSCGPGFAHTVNALCGRSGQNLPPAKNQQHDTNRKEDVKKESERNR